MPRKTDPHLKFFKAAKALIARRGWRGLAIVDIAREAGLSMADAYKIAATREALLDRLAEEVDGQTAEAIAGSTEEAGWRDRAFDAVMTRFDVMMPERDVWRVIYFDTRTDPTAWGAAARRALRSMERLLEAAGLGGSGGPALKARAAGLAALYGRLFPLWLKDEPDQARTMAELDKRLRGVEAFAERNRRAAPEAAEAPAPESDQSTDESGDEGTLH